MQRVPRQFIALLLGAGLTVLPVAALGENAHGKGHEDGPGRGSGDDRHDEEDGHHGHRGNHQDDGDCDGLSGGDLALCLAYCEVRECDERDRPSCQRLRDAWEDRTGSSAFPCDPDTPPDRPCDDLSGFPRGLCVAFCEAQNCDENPNRHSCDVLRRVFFRITGLSTFPCENQTPTATATNTAEPTSTNTPADTATTTPTDTAVPATDTPTPTDTAAPTATDTPTGTPTGTAAATVTDTPSPTPTDTAEPTATDTAEPTAADTPTGTPTGTAAATVTDTPTEIPTETPTETAPTATDTPTETPVPSTSTPTDTATPEDTATPTPTDTPTPIVCPLEAGSYTLTQVSGGTLRVDGLPAFPFPAGGTITQDVSAGDANCVHESIVPFPGGFNAPVFCVPSLGFTVQVTQTGCGVGRIDSDGGSDFTVAEVGDTSSPNICNLPHAGCSNGADSSVQVDVTVGDGVVDTCGSGTANAIVSVPVFTTTWLASSFTCPDVDGTYNPGADTLITSFPQILDFTTDSNGADWSDLDPDGCCIAGAGPGSNTNPCNPGGAGGLSSVGTCLDVSGVGVAGADVTTVASGPIGSSGSPLFDLTFTTQLPNEMSAAGAPLGATCGTPPVIDFAGTATRCIE